MDQGSPDKPEENARIATIEPAEKKARRPFSGRSCLYNIARVRLGEAPFDEPFEAGELFLVPGDQVVADTAKGPMLGTVTSVVCRQLWERGRIRRIIRRASEGDTQQYALNLGKAKDAFNFCLKRIQARNMTMKLCRVEYMLDRSRLLFYFSAEHRIDFRQLVRDLARQYGTRIEMRQIGVRDGAGLIGGIGHCGKELCCCSFLRTHSSISIRHAKDQGITLNPKKVSGMCGRLMCCLVYEHETYQKSREGAPRINRAVDTEKGAGVVTEVDLLQRKVRVVLESGATETFGFDDVRVDNETIRRPQDIKQYASSRPKRPSATMPTESNPDEEYLWEGAEAETAAGLLESDGRPADDLDRFQPSDEQDFEDEERPDIPPPQSGGAEPKPARRTERPSAPGPMRSTPTEPGSVPPTAGVSRHDQSQGDQRPGKRRRRPRRGPHPGRDQDRRTTPGGPTDRPAPVQDKPAAPPPSATHGQTGTRQPAQDTDRPAQPAGEAPKPRRRFRPGRNRGRKPGGV